MVRCRPAPKPASLPPEEGRAGAADTVPCPCCRRHATCRPTSRSTLINPKVLASAIASALPFQPAEEAIDDDIQAAKTPEDIDAAIQKCIANGGRPGCPAIESAEKQKVAIAKAVKEGKPVPKAKSLKPAIGGATPGWANQGEGRKVASTHDNSV